MKALLISSCWSHSILEQSNGRSAAASTSISRKEYSVTRLFRGVPDTEGSEAALMNLEAQEAWSRLRKRYR